MVSAVAAHQESASGCISKETKLSTWQVPSRSPAGSRGDQIGVGSFSRCRYPRSRHSLKSGFWLYPWPNRSFRYRRPPGRRTPTVVFVIAAHLVDGHQNSAAVTIFGFTKMTTASIAPLEQRWFVWTTTTVSLEANSMTSTEALAGTAIVIAALYCALPPFATDQ